MPDRYQNLFGASRPALDPALAGPEWVEEGIFLVNKRTGERRLKQIPGGERATTAVPTPDTSLPAVAKEALGLAGATAADVNVGTARLPSQVLKATADTLKRGAESLDPQSRQKKGERADAYVQLFGTPEAAEATQASREARELKLDPLRPAAELTARWTEEGRGRLAEAAQDLPTPLAVGVHQGAVMAGMLADPTAFAGAGKAPRALSEVEQVAKGGKLPWITRLTQGEVAEMYTELRAIPKVVAERAAGRSSKLAPLAADDLAAYTATLEKGVTKKWRDLAASRAPAKAQPALDTAAAPEGLWGRIESAFERDAATRDALNRMPGYRDAYYGERLDEVEIGLQRLREAEDAAPIPPYLRPADRAPQAPPAAESRLRLRKVGDLDPEQALHRLAKDVPAGPVSAADLPFELRDLPLTRWHLPQQRPEAIPGVEFYTIGDTTHYARSMTAGGSNLKLELFTPENPLVVNGGASGAAKAMGLAPKAADFDVAERALVQYAKERGHDSIVTLHAGDNDLQVIKLPGAKPGAPRSSSYLETTADVLGGNWKRYLTRDEIKAVEKSGKSYANGAASLGRVVAEKKLIGGTLKANGIEIPKRFGSYEERRAFFDEALARVPDDGTPGSIMTRGWLKERSGIRGLGDFAPPGPEARGGIVADSFPAGTPAEASPPLRDQVASAVPDQFPRAGSEASPPFSLVTDDPMAAVFGEGTAAEYRGLEEALRQTTRERLAGRPGRLLPHEEERMLGRLAEIKDSVTPEQWGFAVSGQGKVPPLPEGRLFAQEPRTTGTLGRVVPEEDGVRLIPEDLRPANDAGPVGPRPINPESGAVSLEPLARGVRWAEENFLSAGPYRAAAQEFPEAAQRAFVGVAIPRRLEAARGAHALALDELKGRVKEVERAAKTARKGGSDVSGLWDRISQARHGDIPWDDLPEAVREPARRMWDQIDELSDARVAEGIVSPDDALDAYTHRAYRAFDDPEWARRVETSPGLRDTWEGARSFIQSQVPDLTPDEVTGVVQALVNRYGPRRLEAAVGAPKAANRVLNRRVLSSPQIRRVMGEYTDARVVAEKTVQELSWDLQAYRFWRDIGDQGTALGVFRPSGRPTRDVFHRVGGAGEGEMASRFPAEDLLTREGLKRALTESFETARSNWWSRMAGRVNLGKTVGSIATQERNFYSHGFTAIANGRLPVNPGRIMETARILSRSDLSRRRIAVESGILGQGATAGEVADFIRMAEARGPIARGLSSAGRGLKNLYHLSDDFWRTYNWLGETDDLVWARGLPRPEAERLAADRVRNMVQTYDRAPRIAQKLRRTPFLGSLGATFYTETIRNVGNIARISAEDIAEGIRLIRAGDALHGDRMIGLGLRRYVGLATALSAGYAYSEHRKRQLGISDREESALRRGLPRYDQNAELIFTSRTPEGAKGWDWGNVNPYSVVLRPFIATQRAIEEGRVPVDAVYELMSSLAGGDILATTVAETALGQEIEIWPPGLGRPVDNRAEHLARNLSPGTLNTVEQIASGRRGPEAAAGIRVIPIGYARGVRRRAGELGATYDRAASVFRRAGAKDPEKAVDAYLDTLDKAWRRARLLGEDGAAMRFDPVALDENLYALPREVRGGLLSLSVPDSAPLPYGREMPPLPYFKAKSEAERQLHELLVARYEERARLRAGR